MPSRKVTLRQSMVNRPVCGGPIKSGLAPSATNFNLSVKPNHRFRGNPFVDNKMSQDYDCNKNISIKNISIKSSKKRNPSKIKLYVTTADRFNTERDLELSAQEIEELRNDPDFNDEYLENIENFKYSYEGQIDNQFVYDLFKNGIINEDIFDVTYLYFNRSNDFTFNESLGKKEIWVAETKIGEKRSDVVTNNNANGRFVRFQDYLKENGNPDVLMGRFGSGSTKRLHDTIKEIAEENKNTNGEYSYDFPLGIVWSFTSTAAYLSDKEKYPTVIRSQMSDGNLATMFADWMFTNMKARAAKFIEDLGEDEGEAEEYDDGDGEGEDISGAKQVMKMRLQFITPGSSGDSWAYNLATDLLREIQDLYGNYIDEQGAEDNSFILDFPENIDETYILGDGYKFDDPDEESKLINLGNDFQETISSSDFAYTYTVMLPDPSYSANDFWIQLNTFLKRRPMYIDDQLSTIITGDSFFYYSPEIIADLPYVNVTKILTMAYGNPDKQFNNLLLNWYNLETPKLARIGKALQVLSDAMNEIKNKGIKKDDKAILNIVDRLYGDNGSSFFNSGRDMKENSISVGQIVSEPKNNFLWETLRKASWDHVPGTKPKEIILTVSVVSSDVDYIIRNGRISNKDDQQGPGFILLSEGEILTNGPVTLDYLLSGNIDHDSDILPSDTISDDPDSNKVWKVNSSDVNYSLEQDITYYLTPSKLDPIIVATGEVTPHITWNSTSSQWEINDENGVFSSDSDTDVKVYVRTDGDTIERKTIEMPSKINDSIIEVTKFWENILNKSLINNNEPRAKVKIMLVEESVNGDGKYERMFLNLQSIEVEDEDRADDLAQVMRPYNLSRVITNDELSNYAARMVQQGRIVEVDYKISGTDDWNISKLREHWYDVGLPNGLTVVDNIYYAGDIRIGALSDKTLTNAFAGLPVRGIDQPVGSEDTDFGLGSFGGDITLNLYEKWYRWTPGSKDSEPSVITYDNDNDETVGSEQLTVDRNYYIIANKTDGEKERLGEFKYIGYDKTHQWETVKSFTGNNDGTQYYLTSDAEKIDWDNNNNGWDVTFLLAHEFGHVLGLVDRPYSSASLISIMNQGKQDKDGGMGELALKRKWDNFKSDTAKYGNTQWEIQKFKNLYANAVTVFRPVSENSVENTMDGSLSKSTTFSAVQIINYYAKPQYKQPYQENCRRCTTIRFAKCWGCGWFCIRCRWHTYRPCWNDWGCLIRNAARRLAAEVSFRSALLVWTINKGIQEPLKFIKETTCTAIVVASEVKDISDTARDVMDAINVIRKGPYKHQIEAMVGLLDMICGLVPDSLTNKYPFVKDGCCYINLATSIVEFLTSGDDKDLPDKWEKFIALLQVIGILIGCDNEPSAAHIFANLNIETLMRKFIADLPGAAEAKSCGLISW